MFNAASAAGGHDAELLRIDFEQLRDEVAAAGFKVTEDANFVFKPFGCLRSVIHLDHPTIKGQVDR
jgi:hypothetical protein